MADIVAIYIVLIVAEVEEKKNTLLDFEKRVVQMKSSAGGYHLNLLY